MVALACHVACGGGDETAEATASGTTSSSSSGSGGGSSGAGGGSGGVGGGSPTDAPYDVGLDAIAFDEGDFELPELLGAATVRATPNLGWSGVEPVIGGTRTWDKHDAWILDAAAHGMAPVVNILSRHPADPNAPPGCNDMWELDDANKPAYADFVRAAVRRYDGNGDAEDAPGSPRVRVWSYTPELGTFWCDKGDVAGMAAMYRVTADAVHEVDPTADVVLPLTSEQVYLATFASGYLDVPNRNQETIFFKGEMLDIADAQAEPGVAIVEGLLQAAHADAVDMHLYGDAEAADNRANWIASRYALEWGEPAPRLYSFEGGSPFAKLGESFPTGPAGCGNNSDDPARLAFQSGMLLRHLAVGYAAGFRVLSFNLESEYGDWGTDFGDLDLMDACGELRPVASTFQLAHERLLPADSVMKVDAPNPVKLYAFSRAGQQVFVAWDADAGNETTSYDLTGLVPFVTTKVTQPVTAACGTALCPASESDAPSSAVPLGALPVVLEAAR